MRTDPEVSRAIRCIMQDMRRAEQKRLSIGAECFATANGWKVAGASFSLDQLARRKRSGWPNYITDSEVDHPDYFRDGWWPVAVAAHVYATADMMREYMRQHPTLVLHVAPEGERASWYFPGGTLLVVITRPDITRIEWPTEAQMKRRAAAYAAQKELAEQYNALNRQARSA